MISSALHFLVRIVYRFLLKPFFFLLDPENVHNFFSWMANLFGRSVFFRSFFSLIFTYKNAKLETEVLGIKFKNPVGLSAGFDKDGDFIKLLPSIGFGFSQVGTVTFGSYEGNPKPRLYRLVKSKAIVVYSGLKNIGVDKILYKIKKAKMKNFPFSISVGKTNCSSTSKTQDGIEDYYNCLKKVIESGLGAFYTINISCPNTFGGEPFTTPDELNQLLKKLYTLKIHKPVFLKMPLHLPWKEFKPLLDVAVKFGVDGVIISNLAKDRNHPMIIDKIPKNMKGGISGRITIERANLLIGQTYRDYGDKLKIIGVGGIFTAEDAYEKIKLGACLVQLITGMIFEGPQLIGEINRGLVRLLERDGYKHISDAVGAFHRSPQ